MMWLILSLGCFLHIRGTWIRTDILNGETFTGLAWKAQSQLTLLYFQEALTGEQRCVTMEVRCLA